MNFRSIALVLVVTSPTLLAYAENIRKARESRGPSAGQGLTTDPPAHSEPQEAESQEPQQSDQSTDQTSEERKPVPQSPSPQISTLSTSRTNRKKKPALQEATTTSSHSSYPTNDCITYSILDPWESFWGGCPTYKPGFMPWSNYDYCDEDIGPGGVLAEDACPQCGKCLGPENTCVAFGKRRPFDAGYGGCHTYKKGLENNDYCYSDEDNGIKAFQACPECNKCVESSPRTVTVKANYIIPVDNGDDFNNDVEIIGNLGSQLDGWSRTFWKSDPPYVQIDVGEKYILGKTHYYRDVGDWQDISVKGTLKEYDFGNGDDYLGSQKVSFNVGELYHDGTTKMAHLEWYDRKYNKIKALFSIEVN